MTTTNYLKELQQYHQPQGDTNHCGPYAVATILPLFGSLGISGEYLASHFNRLGSKLDRIIPARIPNQATFPWGMVKVLRQFHVQARWEVFCKRDILISRIETNQIQIVLVSDLAKKYAHYLILAGYDNHLGMGFIDPAFPNGAIHWISEKKFMRQWSQLGRNCILINGPSR